MSKKTLYIISAVLFWASAGLSVFGNSKDLVMGLIWFALGVTFLSLAFSKDGG
jgi:hypothetical protein